MIRARIERSWGQDGYGIWIFQDDPSGRGTSIAKPMDLVFENYREGFVLPTPTIFLKREIAADALRAFQDALSEAEIQSSKQERRDREMLAVKNHLSDAQKIRDRLFDLVERRSK
jgi:hypothetical protein